MEVYVNKILVVSIHRFKFLHIFTFRIDQPEKSKQHLSKFMCIFSSYIMSIGNHSPVKLLFKKVASLYLPSCARLQSLCEDLVNTVKERVDRSED